MKFLTKHLNPIVQSYEVRDIILPIIDKINDLAKKEDHGGWPWVKTTKNGFRVHVDYTGAKVGYSLKSDRLVFYSQTCGGSYHNVIFVKNSNGNYNVKLEFNGDPNSYGCILYSLLPKKFWTKVLSTNCWVDNTGEPVAVPFPFYPSLVRFENRGNSHYDFVIVVEINREKVEIPFYGAAPWIHQCINGVDPVVTDQDYSVWREIYNSQSMEEVIGKMRERSAPPSRLPSNFKEALKGL